MEQEVLQMMGALDNGTQGMAQMSDMEAMSLGDPGYQKIMADQTMIKRNDAASMQKVEEIG